MKAVNDYMAAWNAHSAEERQQYLSSCMSDNVTYVDPHITEPIHGIDEMRSLIERFRSRFDHKLEPDGKLDQHHHVFRLRWRLQRENGDRLSCGLMVGDLSPEGLIERVVHFVDVGE